MDANIGKKLDGRYELLELVGVGGMADIYKARDTADGRIVAAKILKTEFAGSEDFLRRFRNESKAIALLSHPNIVRIFDVGFTGKVQFIIMEYIDGITLAEYIQKQGVLKWRDAVSFTTQILRALQNAHDSGIVHRDVKSSNVMLLSDGSIKVMDFGIARFNRETDKTISEKAIGSVHYISPEQARGEATDEKSDIYSVGVMLYEMLVGKKPFEGDSPMQIALAHMQKEARKPSEINSAIPEGLEEIVLKAMQKDPARRYQTAGEMIKDIEEFKKNPSIVFEYKYFSTDGSSKYFDRREDSVIRRNTMDGQKKDELDYKNKRRGYPDDGDDLDYDDFDEDDYVERRSPLLPILFAVASVFVILTAVLIFKIVTDNVTGIQEAAGEEITMPGLIGMDYDEVAATYSNLNIFAKSEYSKEFAKGQVMLQSPSEGRKIKSNQRIEVTVSKGEHLIQLDDYGGGTRTLEDVKILLKKQGFGEPKVQYVKSDDVTNGYVIDTEPPARERISIDTQITLKVSMGSFGEMTNVPDLINLSERDLAEREAMYKIVITKIYEPSDEDKKDRVIDQSIKPLEKVALNTIVEVTIGTGTPPSKPGKIGPIKVNEGITGQYSFEYYIDGILQSELTKTQNFDLNRDILWEFENGDVHNYAIYVTSLQTGKSDKFCEYRVDFTGTGDTASKQELYLNSKIFRQLNAADNDEEAAPQEPEDSDNPDETEPEPDDPAFVGDDDAAARRAGDG